MIISKVVESRESATARFNRKSEFGRKVYNELHSAHYRACLRENQAFRDGGSGETWEVARALCDAAYESMIRATNLYPIHGEQPKRRVGVKIVAGRFNTVVRIPFVRLP